MRERRTEWRRLIQIGSERTNSGYLPGIDGSNCHSSTEIEGITGEEIGY